MPPRTKIFKEIDHGNRCRMGTFLAECAVKRGRTISEGVDAVAVRGTAVVLVVEDDREMRSLLCDEFWSVGYQLREAKDGDEAFRAVLDSVPDLILTDLWMPAGGADYICRLRTIAPHCPIVVMTAFGDATLKASVLKAGADAYFDKPVRVSDLKEIVSQLLSHNRQVNREAMGKEPGQR